MKRTKKTKPEFMAHKVQWQCPHCRTYMEDYTLNKRILKILCSHCSNPVEFEWNEPVNTWADIEGISP